jgi:hypothetical protein
MAQVKAVDAITELSSITAMRMMGVLRDSFVQYSFFYTLIQQSGAARFLVKWI